VLHAPPGRDPDADEEAPRWRADPGARPGQPGTPPATAPHRACQQQRQTVSHREGPDPPVEGGRPRSRDGALLCPAQLPGALESVAANGLIGINSIDRLIPPHPAHGLSCGRGVEALVLAILDGHHALYKVGKRLEERGMV